MFLDLPDNIKIYATTAANAIESSSATYCNKDAIVNNKNIGTCLGDLYSVNWMVNYFYIKFKYLGRFRRK